MLKFNNTPYEYEVIISGINEDTSTSFGAYFSLDPEDFNTYFNITIKGKEQAIVAVSSSIFLTWKDNNKEDYGWYNIEREEVMFLLPEEGKVKMSILWGFDTEDTEGVAILLSRTDLLQLCDRIIISADQRERSFAKNSTNIFKFKKSLEFIFSIPLKLLIKISTFKG